MCNQWLRCLRAVFVKQQDQELLRVLMSWLLKAWPERTLCLLLLCEVVEEEVDQNGIDVGIGVCFEDLAFDQLNCPDAAATV